MNLTKAIIVIFSAILISFPVFAQKADKTLSVTLVRWAYT